MKVANVKNGNCAVQGMDSGGPRKFFLGGFKNFGPPKLLPGSTPGLDDL